VKCSVCKGYGVTEHYEGRKRVRQDCPKCKGTGQQACPDCEEGLAECEVCKGKGVVKKGCEICGDKGKVDCPDCQGTGERDPDEKDKEESTPRRRFGDPD
jgi:DnaJ-class molecular chaperone